MSDHENLLLKLRQEASGYSPTQQKLGEFVLNDPARVLYLTITELARESGTSEASSPSRATNTRIRSFFNMLFICASPLRGGAHAPSGSSRSGATFPQPQALLSVRIMRQNTLYYNTRAAVCKHKNNGGRSRRCFLISFSRRAFPPFCAAARACGAAARDRFSARRPPRSSHTSRPAPAASRRGADASRGRGSSRS